MFQTIIVPQSSGSSRSWDASPWRWRHCDPSETSRLLMQWHSIRSQTT